MQLDPTGKISLDHIYTQPDPRAYFGTLRELDYRIPELARPYFTTLIEAYRRVHRVETPQVLDIGCSYGINAVLLKSPSTMMDDLYDRYAGARAAARDRAELLALDRELLRGARSGNGKPRDGKPREREPRDGGPRDGGPRVVGLDVSRPALDYAREAGFLDQTVHADLESSEPTDRQRNLLAGADLVVSTGCLGYVTDKTISRVVDAQDGRRPWMAHFVLRMFPFDPIADLLESAGYRTHRVERLFRQRRFATQDEQTLVLANLAALGIDPAGLETEGWFYAQLYVSLPHGTDVRAIMDLTTGVTTNE